MKKEEVRDILSILKLNYPQSFRDWDKQQSIDFIDLWAEAFKDDPTQYVVSAVKAIIYTDPREFAPNIAQVKQKILQLTDDSPTEQEAWQTIKKALQNSIYGAKEEFDKLPENIKLLVGSPRQLFEWATMDSDELNTVVASNFMRSYRQISQRTNDNKLLPNSVKQLIGNTEMKMIGEQHE